ncbi:restriction endonuclease subunit S [Methylomonas koyamae]|uniref:restriction endonuclease subunit S n=1 Tax=Methylomonas koyamae TaxID=702114 RepID=UPI0006D27244|nr:restriction endonuclease subunit S [Methylomonas koyamae]
MMHDLITKYLGLWTTAIASKASAGRGASSPPLSSVPKGHKGEGRGEGNPTSSRNAKYSAYGIKKLRELILELAVRGKLVPQDPDDEPADSLLARIKNELCSIENIKELPNLKRDSSTVDPREFQFDIPNNWIWCELQDISLFSNGKAHEQFFTEEPIYILINSRFVSNDGEVYKYVTERLSPLFENDIAIVMSDVPDGKALVRCFVVENSDRYTLNQRIGGIRTAKIMSVKYLALVLDRNPYYLQYDDGKKQTNLKKIQILSCPIPLPPLAEQHRIVAKVDELMALCDQLEQQQTDHLAAHQTLVQTLLGTLTQAADTAEFEQAWSRIANHFDTLFTTESSIDQLKQTLLQLAVMGKLVPQDPDDEPATKLLERIDQAPKRIMRTRNRDDEEGATQSETISLFELPSGWKWVPFGRLPLQACVGIDRGCSQQGPDKLTPTSR